MRPVSAQQRTATIGKQQFLYRVRRSRRAKHLLLHVDLRGKIEVVVPWRAAYREADNFIREKRVWLTRALAASEEKRRSLPCRQLVCGEQLPVLGEWQRLSISAAAGRRRARVSESGGVVTLAMPQGQPVRPVLVRWYRQRAARYFTARAAQFAAQLSVAVSRVAVSEAKTQWGSCMPQQGRLTLHWCLLLGPRAVADYVIAHEVAHLKERRHSLLFWQLVAQLVPHYEMHRAWLRRFGYTLIL